MKSTFLKFCQSLDNINSAFSAGEQVKILKEYLAVLDDRSLELPVQFLVDGALSSVSGEKITLGSRSISVAASDFCAIDYELVFKPCRQVCTSLSETISVLIANTSKVNEAQKPVTLGEVFEIFNQLEKASNADSKKEILKRSWAKLSPEELFYFNELVLHKPVLKDADDLTLEAICAAFSQSRDAILNSFIKTGSLAKTAVLAKNDNLKESEIQFFHPIPFMNFKNLEWNKLPSFENLLAEKSVPGIQCQIHIKDGKVEMVTDKAENIGVYCTDLISQFKDKKLPNLILDGTLCFCDMNKLISKPDDFFSKKNLKQISQIYTAQFIAQDIFHLDGKSLFEQKLLIRKNELMKLSTEFGLQAANYHLIEDARHLEQLYQVSNSKKEAELILKYADSTYQPHDSKNYWIRLKKPAKKLKALLLYAHSKNGWATFPFTDFTLGISVSGNDQFEEEFIPIGKTSAGNFNSEDLHSKIKEHAFERFGSTLAIKPQFLVDLEYEGVKINKRTKAGFSLQNPILKRIYSASQIDELNTLDDIIAGFEDEQQLNFTLALNDFIQVNK